jgi:hypothetical protein
MRSAFSTRFEHLEHAVGVGDCGDGDIELTLR